MDTEREFDFDELHGVEYREEIRCLNEDRGVQAPDQHWREIDAKELAEIIENCFADASADEQKAMQLAALEMEKGETIMFNDSATTQADGWGFAFGVLEVSVA